MAIEPFKPLAGVAEPDSRQLGWAILNHETGETRPKTLADHHAAIARIGLSVSVPEEVANHFQTAKHLLLYSWFVYRFITVAELHAYASLEYALRERFGHDQMAEKRVPGLHNLLARAVSEGLLTDAGFPSYQVAFRDVHLTPVTGNAMVDATLLFHAGGALPTSRVEILAKALPKLRNALAHGSFSIWPGGYMTLQLVAEAIAQLFPDAVARRP